MIEKKTYLRKEENAYLEQLHLFQRYFQKSYDIHIEES